MMIINHALANALRAANEASVEGTILHQAAMQDSTDINILAGLADHTLAFQPGLRTRDNGLLGDTSGKIEISVINPNGGRLKWSLLQNNKVVAETTSVSGKALDLLSTTGGRYTLKVFDEASNKELGATQVSIPQFIFINVSEGSLKAALNSLGVDAADHNSVTTELVDKIKTVTQHILRPMNVRLLWPGDTLPTHFTPQPLPKTLPLAPTPPFTFDSPSGVKQHIYVCSHQVNLIAPSVIAGDFQNFVTSLKKMYSESLILAISKTTIASLETVFGDLFSNESTSLPVSLKNEDDWYFDGTFSILNAGIIKAGLGGLTVDAKTVSASSGNDIDKALKALGQSVNWSDTTTAEFERYIEFASRQLGVCVARAVGRLVGIPIDDSSDATKSNHLVSEFPFGEHVASNIFSSEPVNGLQDMLGLYRPTVNGQPLSMDVLQANMADQTRLEGLASIPAESPDRRAPQITQWIDTAKLAAAPFHLNKSLNSFATGYDALAGIVAQDSLDRIDGILGMLPSAYGPYQFQPGDRENTINNTDTVPVYGGNQEPVNLPIDEEGNQETDLITQLQTDLRAVGITLGLDDTGTGYYAYQRYVSSNEKYDGILADNPTAVEGASQANKNHRNALKAGYTDWAVREFQIAGEYPNHVAEKFSVEPHYAKRLHVVGTHNINKVTNQPDHASPSMYVNGRMSVYNGNKLRRWRFTRQRYPIVTIAGSALETFGTAGTRKPVLENIMATDGPGLSNGYRVRTIDRSGYTDASQDSTALGYYGRSRWKGPAQAKNDHPQTDLTPGNALGVDRTDWVVAPSNLQLTDEEIRRSKFLSAFRVIASIGEVEAIGHFDGLNAWDTAVFSYPLFHHTLTLTKNPVRDTARPGQMAVFIDWLRNPSNAFLESVFPDPITPVSNGLTNPDYPDPYPDTILKVKEVRQRLKSLMLSVYTSAFGIFGVGSSSIGGDTGFTTITGFEKVTNGNITVDMNQRWTSNPAGRRQQALYQAYSQWFRSWPWFYRFASCLRQDQRLRTLLIAYEMDWVHDKLNGAFNDVSTEKGRAVYLRVAVRSSSMFTRADARRAARRAGDEGVNIRQAIINENTSNPHDSLTGLTGSTLGTMNYNSRNRNGTREVKDPDIGMLENNSQSDTIYIEVRNDMLRRLTPTEDR